MARRPERSATLMENVKRHGHVDVTQNDWLSPLFIRRREGRNGDKCSSGPRVPAARGNLTPPPGSRQRQRRVEAGERSSGE